MAILTVFYSLDSLYAERKDKSILFWRSLPITDAEAVLSKLLTVIIVIPLVTIAAIIVTHLVNLSVSSVWIAIKGGDAGHLVWGSVALLDNWTAATIVTFSCALWMSPFIGWFLFVSAFAKRMPLLMAFMPLILVPLIELIVFRSSYFAEAVFGRGGMMPLFRGMDMEAFFDEDRIATHVAALVQGEQPGTPVNVFLHLALDRDALVHRAVRENVRFSANALRHGSKIIERLIDADKLLIVGAEYSLEYGVVDFFDGAPS